MAAARALSALLDLPLLPLFFFPLGSFLVTEKQIVTMLDMYCTFESRALTAKSKAIRREGVWWRGAKKVSRFAASPLDFALAAMPRALAPTWTCSQARYIGVIWEGYYNSDTNSLPSFLSFVCLRFQLHEWETNVSARSTAQWCGWCSIISTDQTVWGYSSKPRST